MLTYALDEYGDFEGLSHVKGPIYIAGLIYDDHSVNGEDSNERKRIKAYYKSVIEDAASHSPNPSDFSYPEALHSNGDKDRDHTVVRPVKEIVRNSIAEFIQDGTYKGDRLPSIHDRQGEYHIFVILRSDHGMTKLLRENANILAKDDYASNLYFHMADELISRLIFYNPLISNIKKISLDIATRTSVNLSKDDNLYKEYTAQGYKEELKDGKYHFRLTNPDIYRTVIAEEILDAEQPDIEIEKFDVKSIRYKRNPSNNNLPPRMEYLYLSDSICSILGHQIVGNNADEWLKHILNKVKEITGKSQNLVFGYDEIDNHFSKAWTKYLEGDYYKALSITFDAGKLQGAFAEYYRDHWFKILENKIVENANVSDFNMAVRKLYETLNNNTLDQDKCFYILGVLERMAPAMECSFHSLEAKRILYTLYDIGVTASCHIGDSKRAEAYFDKCRTYAGHVSLDDYLSTRNKLVVFCCDYFDLDQAKVLSDENVTYQELLTDLKKELRLPGVRDDGFEAMGKVHSQRGQVYAFRRDPRAEGEFCIALSHFAEGSANYKITQSYLLHYYLDSNNREAYLEEATHYFEGNSTLMGQLSYILSEGARQDPLINMKYALYIYVRALYVFRLPELTTKVWRELQRVENRFGKRIHKKEWRLTGHPSELIFKYMRLIALSRCETALEKDYQERMERCLLYHGATEDAICTFGELEVLDSKGNIAERDTLSLELCRELSNRFDAFAGMQISLDGDSRYHWLEDHLTFMYR